MAMEIEAKVIDALMLGVGGRRRELQDFPVLGDVWARYAQEPAWTSGDREVADGRKEAEAAKELDLLITPTWERPTGEVAKLVAQTGLEDGTKAPYDRKVAYLQGLVVASLTLDDLIDVAIPATKWWDAINDKWDEEKDRQDDDDDDDPDEDGRPTNGRLRKWIGWELEEAIRGEQASGRLNDGSEVNEGYLKMDAEDRQAAKLGLLLGVMRTAARMPSPGADAPPLPSPATIEALRDALGEDAILDDGVKAVRRIIQRHRRFAGTKATTGDRGQWNGLIFQISLNRGAAPAITESVDAIKGDAARALFSISCKEIGWAVLDSGIDRKHPAFWDYEKIWKDKEKADRDAAAAAAGAPPPPPAPPPADMAWPHRIKATFDFRRIRAMMSVDATDHDTLIAEISARTTTLTKKEIADRLAELAKDRAEGRRVNWARVRPLIEHDTPDDPPHPHGTHVAGIIGAHWLSFGRSDWPQRTDPVKMDGVCPDIMLYDFRVLGSTLGDSEFAVIAALQFIRFLNDTSGYSMVHGVNMSLSIPHNVRNYACGRTQVCIEAESLTANGVVVVAAAGNRGFQQYRLADNSLFDGYAASSITDPGNAEGVITVGATHRNWPHTYGVSFFSSRGPTGDGRMKPDLLAPGEKITSCIPGRRMDQMDGTSMAAPHVSGAAALLMARHQELQGQPARIKQILCETATDLKRERSFQGHGMVDVLRAIQSI